MHVDYKKNTCKTKDSNPMCRVGSKKPYVTKHIPLNKTLNIIILFVLCAACLMAKAADILLDKFWSSTYNSRQLRGGMALLIVSIWIKLYLNLQISLVNFLSLDKHGCKPQELLFPKPYNLKHFFFIFHTCFKL